MDCRKYFKPNQKVTLRFVDGSDVGPSTVVSAILVVSTADHFDVMLPYPVKIGETGGSILPGSQLLVLSENYGLGTQVSGTLVAQISETLLRIRYDGNLEVFFRRQHFRVETEIGLHLKRTKASLATLRTQWATAVRRVAAGEIPRQMAILERQRVNLSAGGLALALPRPVATTELVPLLLDLGDGNGPIWALGEIVWMQQHQGESRLCGVRFVDIIFADKERINAFVVAELKRRGEDVDWYASRRKQLNKMEF